MNLSAQLRKWKPTTVEVVDATGEVHRIAPSGRHGQWSEIESTVSALPQPVTSIRFLGPRPDPNTDAPLLWAASCEAPATMPDDPASPVDQIAAMTGPNATAEERIASIMLRGQAMLLDRFAPILAASAELLSAAATRAASAEVSVVELLRELREVQSHASDGVADPREQLLYGAIASKLGIQLPPQQSFVVERREG